MYAIDAHSDETAAAGWGNTTDQYERWVDSKREFADELLAHAQSLADECGVTLETVVAFGNVTDVVREYCTQHPIATVVVGSTDRDAFSSYVVADDVTRIATTAPVPVVVV
jgi:nucleotide-binding universal stress UspA family protein